MVTVDRRKEPDAVKPLLRKSLVEKVAAFNVRNYEKGLCVFTATVGVTKAAMVWQPHLSSVMQNAINYESVAVAEYFVIGLVSMVVDEQVLSSRRSENLRLTNNTLE